MPTGRQRLLYLFNQAALLNSSAVQSANARIEKAMMGVKQRYHPDEAGAGYLFEPEFGVVDLQNDAVHALGSLDTAVTLTTPDDVGAFTAEIVFAQPRIRNEIVYLAGDTVTYGEVADKLQAGLGRPFSRAAWSGQYLLDELAQDPRDMMRKYRAAFAQGRGVAWDKSGTFNQQRALPATDVASWINANLAVGRASSK